MSPRVVIAALVVAVGGSLWAVLPDNPGSLRDESRAVRWVLPPGRGLAAWVLLRNPGPDRITLLGATIGSRLPAGVRLLGTAVRRGHFPAADGHWPSPRPAFVRLQGYVMEPRTKATIAFGLQMPGKGRARVAGVRITYRQDDHDHQLRIGAAAALRVAVPRS